MTSCRKKYALIQYGSSDHHRELISLTRQHHGTYCKEHDIDYLVEHQPLDDGRTQHWRKIGLLREAAEAGYDKFAWLDADCVVVRTDFNVLDAVGFGIAACECFDSPSIERHVNTGVLLCKNSAAVREFLDIWDRTPRIGDGWQDQSAFIYLMSSRPHRDFLTVLPNRFNCLDVHMEAREPFIRAFHGDPERLRKMRALMTVVASDSGPVELDIHPSAL